MILFRICIVPVATFKLPEYVLFGVDGRVSCWLSCTGTASIGSFSSTKFALLRLCSKIVVGPSNLHSSWFPQTNFLANRFKAVPTRFVDFHVPVVAMTRKNSYFERKLEREGIFMGMLILTNCNLTCSGLGQETAYAITFPGLTTYCSPASRTI